MDGRATEAVRLMAGVLLDAGRHDAALRLLDGLLAQNPDDLAAQRAWVSCRLRRGDYDQAEPVARRLAESEAGDARAPALFQHAHALWGLGRFEESRAAVEAFAGARPAARP